MDRNPTLHHAQCQIDLTTVRDMLQDEEPNMESLITVGRLLIRYSGVSKESAATEILAADGHCSDSCTTITGLTTLAMLDSQAPKQSNMKKYGISGNLWILQEKKKTLGKCKNCLKQLQLN